MNAESPSTDWKEVIAPDEGERFEGYAAMLAEVQRRRDGGRATRRALHPKPHVGARARFEVLADLPDYARQGLFAKAATYDALVRFSNGAIQPGPDRRPDVRGVAIKVLGVDGRKLIPGLEHARTQDYLMILQRSIPFRDSAEFIFFVAAALHPLTLLPRMIFRFGFLRALRILWRLVTETGRRIVSMAEQTYYAPVPIQYGPYAVHTSLRPVAGAAAPSRSDDGPDYLANDLIARLGAGDLAFDFRVQFFRDAATTPIEDASVEWSEERAPFVTVARLVLPRQDLGGADGERLRAWIERLSFDPWHALVEHRPLGDIMRARSAAYRVSTSARGALAEPDSVEPPASERAAAG
jgi:hypothetical protein